MSWLHVHRGDAPLIVSMPHTGTEIPHEIESHLVSPWLARKDADWWIDRLYDFSADLGATVVRTSISRTVIDVNRDPSGKSLYPGQTTTELCPTTTFDGEPLYAEGHRPDAGEIASRRELFFAPYHAALADERARLRSKHDKVVLYEAHSIRSLVPRLFDGELPNFNIGNNNGVSCAPELSAALEFLCDASGFSRVTNGRFKGGYTTRHYGNPASGTHAVQMELACRGYMVDPDAVNASNWPAPHDPILAEPMRKVLRRILEACLEFTSKGAS
jgi:N-formylglutamate deformylase